MAQVQAKADRPVDLPIVESCVRQVKQQDNSQKSAIKICTKKLQEAGRIEKRGDQWVQLSGQRQRQQQNARQQP